MITIITGVPGMGKTASTVADLLQNDNLNLKARPVFVMGVNGLILDHSKVPPVSEWTEKRPDPDDPTLMLDYFKFPPNSILWIDEAQRVFPARVSGTKVPPHVAALATHRHTALDIWISTQKPMQLDAWCRELAGRHIHLKNTLLGRYLYEWPEYQDPNNKTNLSEAAKRKFSPPKKVFGLYKSAEAHTTQPRRLHQVYLLLTVVLLAMAFLSYRLYNGLYKRITHQDQPDLQLISEAAAEVKTHTPKSLTPVKASKPAQVSIPEPAALPKHPYKGFTFHIKATLSNSRFQRTYYEITDGVNYVFTNSDELKKLGYEINQPSDCAAFLYFQGAEVIATCSSGGQSPDAGGSFAIPKPIQTEIPEPVEPDKPQFKLKA